MQQTMIPNSGIMTVPQIAAPQLVYLDFDGELASYNGELLTIDRVEVEDSGLTEPQIARIVSGLNEEFEGQNIVFTAEKPASGEYSCSSAEHPRSSRSAPSPDSRRRWIQETPSGTTMPL